MTETDRRALYEQGIAYFNECDFFEAHEVWEELWADTQGESRPYYQGLIQTAVALHHFGNGNIRGALKLYRSSGKYLEGFRPNYQGLNVDKLLAEMDQCFAPALAAESESQPGEYPEVEIDAETIPEIHLDGTEIDP